MKFNNIVPKSADHQHNPIFVQKFSEFLLVNPGSNDLYKKVDYAILLCKGCGNVEKTVIKDKDLNIT